MRPQTLHYRASRRTDGRLGAAHAARDEGSTSIELVVLFPAVLLCIFGLIQGALWYHARDVATAAAAAAATTARAETGTAETGRQRGEAFLARTGDAVLDPQVSVTRDAARVVVQVTGRSVSLLPGIEGPAVEETATGPVERFTSRADA